MDEKTVASFYQLINNLIDEKLSKQDKIEICQIVSDDNGSGKYNIRLLSGENTIIHDVVSSRKISFKNGDYAYILKIQNKLNNAIIIGGNAPRVKQWIGVKKEKSGNYKISFTLGDYVLSGFLSTNPNAEWGSPSGTYFPTGAKVYYFVQIFPDDSSYRYECKGVNIIRDIYRIGDVTVQDRDINLPNISNVTRYNAGQYPITAVITNGSLGSSSDTTIQEGLTATLFIVPDEHYNMPLRADFVVSGCTISNYNVNIGRLVIAKEAGNTDPVSVSVTCFSTETHNLGFSLGANIIKVMWSLNGVAQTPVTSTTILPNVLTYGDSLEWYGVPAQHYTTEYNSTNPYITVVTEDLNYSITASLIQCPVTFTLGNYVTSAFTSINQDGTNPQDSGHTYAYGTRVYYFVEKYANTSTDTYTCSGTWVSGNVYRLGYIDVTELNGDLGELSSVTHTEIPVLPDPIIELTWSNYHSTILVKVTNPSNSPANVDMWYEYEYDVQTGTISDHSQFANNIAPGSYATFYINEDYITETIDSGYLTITFNGSPGSIVQPSNKTISLTPHTITTTVSHGSVVSGSDTKIWPQDSAYVYIQPNTDYVLPNNITVTGASYDWDSAYSTNLGLVELFNETSDITISVTCAYNPATYSLTFTMGIGVYNYNYSLYTSDDYQGPYSTDRTENNLLSGTNYYFYVIPQSGYVTNYTSSDACVGEITTQSKTENLANYVYAVYSYTKGYNAGISTLQAYRVSSPYMQAALGNLNNSDTIYDGDEIYFIVSAASGYTVSTDYYDSNHTLTVTGDVTGVDYITVTQQTTLDAPTVGLAWGLYKDYVHVIVRNPSSNPTVNLSYYTSYETSTNSYDDDGTVGQIASGGSNVFEISAPGEIVDGYVDATISASGYTSYTAEEDFFNSGSSLVAPTISTSYNVYRDTVTITISNSSANPVLTCSWYGEYDTSTQSFSDYGIITITPNGTGVITLNVGAGAIQQGFVDLTFKATGYDDYITSRSF